MQLLENKYIPWPDRDDDTLSFDLLTKPVCEAIRFAYELERRNQDSSIPWSGPDVGRTSTSLQPKERLDRENLEYSLDHQGRDALREIIGIAIQLGIEQGRRLERQSLESELCNIQMKLHRLIPQAFEK